MERGGLRLERLEVKRGDVVLVVVPSELGRPGPGVVVQGDEFNERLSMTSSVGFRQTFRTSCRSDR